MICKMAVQTQLPRLFRTVMVVYMVIASLYATITAVPDGLVYTDLHKTAQKGDQLVLKCDFYGTPFGVYWKKGDDPIRSPNLITWVDGESPSGSCVLDGACEMRDDFSLIIKQAKISDRGTYICRVSNHLGILIHNFTDVAVFAPPLEPYPIIDGCPKMLPNDSEEACSIATSDTVSIKCSASSYFPDIDLFFLRGSQEMNTKDIEESINQDGTKSKTISTTATASETPYVCVASGIPGSQARRTMTVLVTLTPTVTMMTTSQTTSSPSGGVSNAVKAVIVVIILLAAGCICGAIILWCLRKRRRSQGKDDEEAVPLNLNPEIDGKISFFELWCLVQTMGEKDLPNLRVALINLGIREVNEGLTADLAYEILCEWKDRNKHRKEGKILKNELFGYGIGDLWKNMCERRQDTKTKVSEELLEHILRTIGNEGEIDPFLRKLLPDHPTIRATATGEREHIVKEAMKELLRWRDGIHNENQVIMLSLALDKANCRPLDRTFFKVPDHLLKAISLQEVEGFVYRLTRRHYGRLAEAVKITDENKIAALIDDNNKDFFNAQSMVSDWIAGQECSNFERRCRLDDAIIVIGRYDMLKESDCFGTIAHRADTGSIKKQLLIDAKLFSTGSIFDDDLQTLLKYLPTDAIPLFLEKLGIPEEEEGGTVEEKLRGWRDKAMRESKAWSLQNLVSIHREALNETNNRNIFDLQDDELENLVENISKDQMEDLIPRLQIDIDNQQDQSPLQRLNMLMEWRDKQKTEKRRQFLRKALNDMRLSGCIVDRRPARHVYQAEMVRLAFSILCNDVGPLASLLGMDTNKGKIVREPTKGTVGLLLQLLKKSEDSVTHHRRDFCVALSNLGYLDAARLAYFDYEPSLTELFDITSQLSQEEMGGLMNHLGGDKAVVSLCRGTTGQYDNFTHMKMWRNQFRKIPFHYNFKLALGFRAIGRTEIADDLLAGGYQATLVSSSVVINLCNSMDDDQLEQLGAYLGLNELGAQNDRKTLIYSIVEWVGNWLKQFDKTPAGMQMIKDKFSFRRHENDELFRRGFFELAEEIMLLEYPRFPSV